MTGMFNLLRRALGRGRYVFVLMALVHLLGGLAFSFIEQKSFGDGQWWATVTGFTVGYGDLYPSTEIGRIVGQVYIILMAFVWLFAGAHVIAAIIEDKNLYSHEEQERDEAFDLEVGQHLGILPQDLTQMPPLSWFKEKHNFQPSPD